MATLLAIVQDVADRVGLVRPTTVISSTNEQARQLLAYAQQEGRELARRHNWQALTFEKTLTTIAQESQTGAIPAGFDRFVKDTFYNRTSARPVAGPLTAQEYADYKGRLTSIVYEAFRVRGDAILILPTPSAGQTLAYEYLTKYWCSATGGTTPTQAEWTADTDIHYLDDELFRMGTQWRYLRSRGLDYTEVYSQYEMMLAQLAGRDGGARTLTMGSRPKHRPMAPVPPDGNWDL